MTKKVDEMNDDELIEACRKGRDWLITKESAGAVEYRRGLARLEDIMDEMGLQIDRIPVDAASDFVRNITREIPQEENRILFKNVAFSRIPKA